MALGIGLVGLPNVGKSTLFNALTKAQNAVASNYPFCTIEPNKASAPVPDERVDALAAKVKPQKTIYARVDFIDIAGLARGASKGEGLGNQFLANIRECQAILEVVRCFENENITHVDGSVNPERDVETIETELLLADIQSVEKRLEKTRKLAKASKDAKPLVEILENLLAWLDAGKAARDFPMPDSDAFRAVWRELSLLTAKPVIYCANIEEAPFGESPPLAKRLKALADDRGAGFAVVCAKLEEEAQGLEEDERKELLASFGVEKSGLETVLRAGYKILGLSSYFTAGPDEVRAWTIKTGSRAPEAAGVIHGDFEKGFIRAEVISYDDYMKYPNEAACRTAGVLRVEGKDYEVRDGDIMHFLFNV